MKKMNYKEDFKVFMFYLLCSCLAIFCGILTIFALAKIATIIFPEG